MSDHTSPTNTTIILPDAENPFMDPCVICGSNEVEFMLYVRQIHTVVEKGNERRARWKQHGEENFFLVFCFCSQHKPHGAQVLLGDDTYFQLNTKDRRFFMSKNDFEPIDGG